MQKQTLEKMLLPITAKANLEQVAAQEKSDVQAKVKEPTYFEKHRTSIVSGEAANQYASAINMGKANAELFMVTVKDPKHPKHSEAVKSYRNEYNSSLNEVVNKAIEKASDDIKAPHPEDLKEDPAYEERMIAALRPKQPTHESMAFFQILKDNLKKSRDKRGYGKNRCHDQEVVREHQYNYGQL